MTYNPYAPPQDPQGLPEPAHDEAATGSRAWSFGEALSLGFTLYRANWGVMTLAMLASLFVAAVPMAAVAALVMPPEGQIQVLDPHPASVALLLTSLAVLPFLRLGLARMALVVARGGTPTVGLLFSVGDRYFAKLGVSAIFDLPAILLTVLYIAVDTPQTKPLALVFPAVIGAARYGPWVPQMMGLYFSVFVLADDKVGTLTALRRAWEVPALVGYPVVLITAAVIYTRLTGTIENQPSPVG